MKKSKKTKDMSIYEASDFWDEHDFGEFDDIKEEKEIQFLFIKKKYIGIDMGLYEKIKNKAKKLNKTEDALINECLS